MKKPLISIITVSYNEVQTIEATIRSVLSQTYPYIQYIVIDGGSTDGTVDIIKKYSDILYFWCSEPDKGIYDAMNKGIAIATGEFVNFMNAGDCFFCPKVVSRIFNKRRYADFLCGIAQYRFHYPPHSNKQRIQYWMPIGKKFRFSQVKNGYIVNHQASFIKRKLFENSPYEIQYRIIADELFFIKKIVFEGYSYVPLPMIVCLFDGSGLSHSEAAKNIPNERKVFYSCHDINNIQSRYKDKTNSILLYNIRNRVHLIIRAIKLRAIIKIDNLFYK